MLGSYFLFGIWGMTEWENFMFYLKLNFKLKGVIKCLLGLVYFVAMVIK